MVLTAACYYIGKDMLQYHYKGVRNTTIAIEIRADTNENAN